MKLAKKLHNFIEEYNNYESTILSPTLLELNNYLKELEKPQYWNKYTLGDGVATPSPIRMIMSRIKDPEKAIEKIHRKPNLFPDQLSIKSIQKMHDALGVRILVYFPSQLSLIDRELRNSSVLEIDEHNPPEAFYEADKLKNLGLSHIENKHKESGYCSIHYMMKLKQSVIPPKDRPVFEIQVRTLAQELWSELEHVLSYKPETRPHFSAKRRFQILSREIAVIDEHFDLLYEELIYSQKTAIFDEKDTITFENAPKVLADIGIQCALTELYPIIRALFSRGITTIGKLYKIATPTRLMTIRNTYISETGNAPNNLELTSALSVLKNANSKEVEIERIKSQIELQNIHKEENF
ncbi:GTP pyrophosphokinase [Tenacibaculum sp. MEBiC06402]|uniref:GTP pyrophosphokinase n=1 Tax=unclassified Tenacibaculum TaxID=2635139 RepID=UPI003B9A0826